MPAGSETLISFSLLTTDYVGEIPISKVVLMRITSNFSVILEKRTAFMTYLISSIYLVFLFDLWIPVVLKNSQTAIRMIYGPQ